MATVGVILSGCGIFDGSEIHESVLTLLALDKAGASVQIFAPSGPQKHVVDHVRNKVVRGEERDILEESARIARGKIQDISRADLYMLDALIFPGGSGIVKNLSNFSEKGPQCTLLPKVERLIIDALEEKKVMGFMCLAPLLAAKAGVRAGHKPLVTLGNDPDMAKAVESMGAEHKNCTAGDIVIDTRNHIVTTPAYMLARSISEAETGISKLVRTVLSMI
ncbi:MAG: isoprenoid biosynthesis protein ElbB [Candidatus Neomarinimicrobiota bacterium]|nr:isoprenoid biosynthesis glyoxalase ElbB [Candidatus Neomarinimicrobiota bacterium]RKY51339.1 MAG: isoprenoid biosynthesis protein ElbB [Candidatus Neomarinimicrobiota bacterium]